MQLQFIDSGGPDGIRKLEGRQRKLVRSYVMKGRNLNKTIRRGKCNQQASALQSVKHPASSFGEKQRPYKTASIPRRVGDEFSGFQFAFELEPYMRRAMYNCEYTRIGLCILEQDWTPRILHLDLTSLSEHMYPMQVCLPRNPTDDIWFSYTLVEPACKSVWMNCMRTVQRFIDPLKIYIAYSHFQLAW